MSDLDRLIADSLSRRASSLPAVPNGFGDIDRRIVRRRRRSASMATAAVTLPAIAAFGWATTRPEPAPSAYSPDGEIVDPMFATTTTGPWGSQYRCTGGSYSDGQWTYFEYCEPAGFTTTIVPPTTAGPMVTTDIPTMLNQVLFVDATGGLDFRGDLFSRLGTNPVYEVPATRTVQQTMVMPLGADVAAAYQVASMVGVGGFDTWTADLIGQDVPAGVTVVVVLGADWPDRVVETDPTYCPPITTIPATSDVTVDTVDTLDTVLPATTVAPTTTTSTMPC